MAKKQIKTKRENFTAITTPSAYGSHKSMVIQPPESWKLKENEVCCKDDTHIYITTIDRLDNGLADPNRQRGRL
jgi:hypothetical protein